MMKQALITGIRGFAGSWLAAELLNQGYTVYGLDLKNDPIHNPQAANTLDTPADLAKIPVHASNLSQTKELSELIQKIGNCTIFHLAGTAFVPESWKSPLDSLQNNTSCTLRLIEAARDANWQGRFLFISSSDIYGAPKPEKLPITEKTHPNPSSPYAQSKFTAEQFLKYYASDKIEILISRPFNHTGPGQRDVFVIPAFVNRVKEACDSGKKSIHVGDLSAIRDFCDVRDVVSAYRIITELGQAGETYNICSGIQTKIHSIIDIILELADSNLTLEIDSNLLRPEGTSIRYGDPAKLKHLGWQPGFSLRDTIQSIWESYESFT